MPSNPIELEQAHERLAQLLEMHRAAAMRPALMPRIPTDAWRGPAYELYVWRVDATAARLRDATRELSEAVRRAREEVLDVAS